MQTAAQEAFDLNQETRATKQMYGYEAPNRNILAQNCSLARRLIERGVRKRANLHRQQSALGHALEQ